MFPETLTRHSLKVEDIVESAHQKQAEVAVETEGYAPPIRWTLASLSLSMLLSALGTSSANVALPTIAQAFDASFQQVQWVVLTYLLAITTLVVSAGRLGDMVGRRRLLLAGLLIFTLASALCGAASTLPVLIAARAVQGAGAAIMMALTMALVGEAVPKEKAGSAMGLLGTMSAVGTALGPSMGGVLITAFGWHSIFVVNLPLGAIAIILAYRFLPVDRLHLAAKRPSFDHAGTALLTFALAAYALAMTAGPGRFGMLNALLVLASATGAMLFILVEKKAKSPLIRLSLFHKPVMRTGFAVSALSTTVVMTTLVVGPFYLSGALALDPSQVGIVMACGPVFAALTGIPAGRAADRFGARRMTVAGLATMLIGSILLSAMPAQFGVLGYILPLLIVTAGYAMSQAANNTAVMADASTDERGVVSGLLSLSRNLGLVTGASLMGAVFAFGSGVAAGSSVRAEEAASGMHITFAVAAALVSVALALLFADRARAA